MFEIIGTLVQVFASSIDSKVSPIKAAGLVGGMTFIGYLAYEVFFDTDPFNMTSFIGVLKFSVVLSVLFYCVLLLLVKFGSDRKS